ncbi:MAG: DUF1559 domain-containing protein [Kiritimatiellaeota bacterium]|nr:DUF1559 domain-containing protein [Kiritimatiellota bacterium]
MRKWRNRRMVGFSLTEVMLVAAIVSSIPTGAYVRARQRALQLQCMNNLQQIGKAILMYYYTEGYYPKAKFFPKNPLKDPDSIVTVLESAGSGIPREMWVCPAAPDPLRKKGLTFVYNDQFAGRQALKNPSRAWLLIEVNCVSKRVPAPHPGGYNILFADGHVITTRTLPPSITSKQQAMLRRLRTSGRLALLDFRPEPKSTGTRDGRRRGRSGPIRSAPRPSRKLKARTNRNRPTSDRGGKGKLLKTPNPRGRPDHPGRKRPRGRVTA